MTEPRPFARRAIAAVLGAAAGLPLVVFLAAGCAPVPPPVGGPPEPASLALPGDLAETPVPDGDWRGHRLARCPADGVAPPAVEAKLALCAEYFRGGSGSDGMLELELTMAETGRHPLVLLTLGQLYLMAGQGVPELLPEEGPAADTGDWERNRPRLLGRARALLEETARSRPDDAAVDYLLADVARAGGDAAAAERHAARGRGKCTGGRSFTILRQYQELNLYPARLEANPPPQYPARALQERTAGRVTLDLLLDPDGRVRQVVQVAAPSPDLARAAAEAFRAGRFAAPRVGKYPVWGWLRVATNFKLADDRRTTG
ncbi:MAG: TonB family protein [Candidatus Krumholzibacteriia bacterium]